MGEIKHLRELLTGAREVDPPAAGPSTLMPGNSGPPRPERGIPPRRQADTFGTFALAVNPGMQAAFDACVEVAEKGRRCAWLVGPPGNGKTHLAIAAMNAYAGAATFWKVPDFLIWMREMRFDREYADHLVVSAYLTGDFLLVLDDLGAEKVTDWSGEQLYRVLDARYDNNLPTIVTSNVGLDQVDPRLASRLRDGFVLCEGADVRGRLPKMAAPA